MSLVLNILKHLASPPPDGAVQATITDSGTEPDHCWVCLADGSGRQLYVYNDKTVKVSGLPVWIVEGPGGAISEVVSNDYERLCCV